MSGPPAGTSTQPPRDHACSPPPPSCRTRVRKPESVWAPTPSGAPASSHAPAPPPALLLATGLYLASLSCQCGAGYNTDRSAPCGSRSARQSASLSSSHSPAMRSTYPSTVGRSAGIAPGHWFGPRSRSYGGSARGGAGGSSGASSTCSRRSAAPARAARKSRGRTAASRRAPPAAGRAAAGRSRCDGTRAVATARSAPGRCARRECPAAEAAAPCPTDAGDSADVITSASSAMPKGRAGH
eukprot:scaffold22920_cov101-Isochrysis_galbana.AAC.1